MAKKTIVTDVVVVVDFHWLTNGIYRRRNDTAEIIAEKRSLADSFLRFCREHGEWTDQGRHGPIYEIQETTEDRCEFCGCEWEDNPGSECPTCCLEAEQEWMKEQGLTDVPV